MRKIDRVGESFVNQQGSPFTIIEYNSTKDVVVEFQDEFKARVHTAYHHCLRGGIKNPYAPSVFGIGCLGELPSNVKININGKKMREYTCWQSMLQRCYSAEYQKRYPSYIGCEVCERWRVFANFLEDLPKIEGYQFWRDNPNHRISLDKDIKGDGTKIYSIETCCFISNADNIKEANNRRFTV